MKKLTALLLILALALSMAACGEKPAVSDKIAELQPSSAPTDKITDPTEETAQPTEETVSNTALLPGYYIVKEVNGDGQDVIGSAQLDAMKIHFQFLSDGTGALIFLNAPIALEWTESTITIDGSSQSYTLEDQILTIGDTDSGLIAHYCGESLPEGYRHQLTAGYFVASSLGNYGDVSFYGSMDPKNGYLRLNEDHTGVFYFEGNELSVTWQDCFIYIKEDDAITYMYHSYYDPELGRNDLIITIVLPDGRTLALRPVEESE